MLELPGGLAGLEWRRSGRARRVSLRIDPRGGAIIVTLPMRASRRAGMALVMNHTGWLADRLAALPEAFPFPDAATIPTRGPPSPGRAPPAPHPPGTGRPRRRVPA